MGRSRRLRPAIRRAFVFIEHFEEQMSGYITLFELLGVIFN